MIYFIVGCHQNCHYCFSGSSMGCIECNEPTSFIDPSTKSCYPVCQNNQKANYRYESNKMCQGRVLLNFRKLSILLSVM